MGNVLRFNGVAGDGYAEFDWAGSPEIYVTFDARFPASYISYVTANPFSAQIFQIADVGAINTIDDLFLHSAGAGLGNLWLASQSAAYGTVAPNTWYTIEYRINGNVASPYPIDLWLDGASLFSGTAATNPPPVGQVVVGLFFTTANDPDQQFDVDNMKIGTSRGGTELMGPADFETATIAPPFTTFFDSSGTGASIFVFSEPTPPIPGQSSADLSVFIDEIEVTEFCVEGSVTKRLNGVGTASVKLNMRMAGSTLLWGTAFPGAGSYLKVYFRTPQDSQPVLYHHGRILNCETSADENAGYTVFNSSDPLELWTHRPVRDPPDIDPPPVGYGQPGNFSKPYLLQQFGDPVDNPGVNGAPRVVWAMLDGSELNSIPSDSEGPLRLQRGAYAGGVVGKSVVGAPTDWPMTMAEMASNLTSTGICDIIVTPIEFDASLNYGRIDVYNGDFGMDLSSSVQFQYGFGVNNVRALRWNEDMTNLCNKLWYYLGPKCDDQHWPANVQGDDPAFNSDGTPTGAWANATPYVTGDVVTNNGAAYIIVQPHTSSAETEPGVGKTWTSFWTYWMVPPGGRNSPTASAVNNPLGVNIMASRALYDARMDIRIFDALAASDECFEGNIVDHAMWRHQWQREAWLRAYPRNLVHVTPTRDTAIGEFDIGDLVLVEASAEVKGGFSGVQRIYQYTISWSASDSVPALSELQVSSDQEGFS